MILGFNKKIKSDYLFTGKGIYKIDSQLGSIQYQDSPNTFLPPNSKAFESNKQPIQLPAIESFINFLWVQCCNKKYKTNVLGILIA